MRTTGAKTDRRGWEDLKSDRVLLCWRDHVTPDGCDQLWAVMLADGYVLDCGVGKQGEVRANDVQRRLNASRDERLTDPSACDRDGAEGGDANAAPVPQDRHARAEGIARPSAPPSSSQDIK